MKLNTMFKTTAALAVTALALSACSSSSGDEANDGPIALTMLTHYGSEPLKSGLQDMVDEWNSANPDIQVTTQAVKYDDLLKTITIQQTSGRSADIVQSYSLWGGQLDKANVLAEVPDDVVADISSAYSPTAIGSAEVDGKIVGYPTEVQTYALFYNKKLLAEAGYDAPPQTWDEMAEIAAATTQTDAAGNTTVEGFGLHGGWDSAAVHPWQSLMQSAGGSFLSDDGTEATFASEAGVAALEFEAQLFEDGSADLGFNTLAGFPANQTAMTINAGWWIGSLKTIMGEEYANIGVAPVPGPEAGQVGSVGYGFFMGVTKSSKKQDAAWEFLTWLNAEKNADGVTRMGEFQYDQGTIPGRTDDATVLADVAADPNLQVFVDALTYAVPESNSPAGQEIKTELHKSIDAAWVGSVDAKKTLEGAQDFANSKLGN